MFDARCLAFDPAIDGRCRIAVTTACEKLQPQLLEIALETRNEQPLPLIRGFESGNFLLGPVETERFAQPGISLGQLLRVELALGGERRNAKYTVYSKSEHPVDDRRLAKADRC